MSKGTKAGGEARIAGESGGSTFYVASWQATTVSGAARWNGQDHVVCREINRTPIEESSMAILRKTEEAKKHCCA